MIIFSKWKKRYNECLESEVLTVKPPQNREFTLRIAEFIKSIPRGRVSSYGRIAALAGDARQARQVAWILHSSSEKQGLPWHRVIGSRGRISLPPSKGGREQRLRLEAEGVRVCSGGTVDLRKYGWEPASSKSPALARLDIDKLVI